MEKENSVKIRKLIYESFMENETYYLNKLLQNIIELSKKYDLKLTTLEIKKVFSHIFYDLVIERIVSPARKNDLTNKWDQFSLTEFGKKVVSESPPHYFDFEGYIDHIKQSIPGIDDRILVYIENFLKCFTRGIYFSAVVMLGCAAEEAIKNLYKAMQINFSEFKPLTKETSYKLSYAAIKKDVLNKLNELIKKKLIPYEVNKGVISHIEAYFELIRIKRNETVHDIANELNYQEIYCLINIFHLQLISIYKIINWCNENCRNLNY